ncbi:MAG: tRNA (adenosine(37)-N6)-threonylcarbamoyltransferase complex transferase subunit TsaD [bacterium]
MYVLGIDTSCDDTGVAIVEDGRTIRSAHLSSQASIHEPFGGVVPEIASRAHAQALLPLLRHTLKDAGFSPKDLDAIAVTQGPGLVGCLLVGITLAKAYALGCDLPLVAVNHLNAHVYSAVFGANGDALPLPHVSLVVSGGHTAIYLVRSFDRIERLASTRDDAAGEAFDKVANLLGLPYPGGPAIEKRAQEWNGDLIPFPRPLTGPTMAFSFSGLKTAVARYVQSQSPLSDEEVSCVAASFQSAVSDILVEKTLMAARHHSVSTITLTGGVAANRTIRNALRIAAEANGLHLVIPPPDLCTDNGVMIAGLGTVLFEMGRIASLDLDAQP